MDHPKPTRLLKKDLTREEQQAYEGARMFYYCFQPTAFLFIFSLQFYAIELAIKQSSSLNLIQLLLQVAGTASAVTFFFIANHYYRRCCEIDICPADKQLTIEEGNQTCKQLETSRSEDDSEKQGELLGGNKPNKVWCEKCEQLCEYRTRHCRKCRVCVERYDHHCFWLGNCVGRHNHRQFYFFLLFQTLCTFFVLTTLFHLSNQLSNIWWGLTAIRICMIILAFGFICFTGYLLIYHTMLICSGITTWEHMRRSRIGYLKYLPPGHNPFSLGILKNWQKFLNEKTRATEQCYLEEWGSFLPTFDEAKTLPPAFNIIQNQYYSCC